MVRKPASMYRNVKQHSFTRREYMGGVPGSQITHYDMGNKTAVFPIAIALLADERCQIRHTALEAARITANRAMVSKAEQNEFHIKLHVYPHEVLRENKQATGAGADRVSSGMSLAFGKNVSTAARISKGQKIFTISVKKEHFLTAKDALRKAGHKLPTPIRIIVDKGMEFVQ